MTLFHNAVLEHERSNALRLKPARHIMAFQIDSQCHESSAGGNDDAGSRGLGSFWKVDRQSRGHHVENHATDGSILFDPFLLGPRLGAWSYAGPYLQGLRVGAESRDKHQGDCTSHTELRPPHISFPPLVLMSVQANGAG